MKRQHKLLAWFAVAVIGFAGAACGDDDDDTSTGGDGGGEAQEGPEIKIADQGFGESQILKEIYAQALDREGFETSTSSVNSREVLFGAFDSGDVNLAPEYVASELNYLEAGAATSDVDESLDKLRPLLEGKGLYAWEASDAVDNNVFVMKKDKADDLGIATLSDLAEKGSDLKLGAPQDCSTNPFCIPGLESVYGLDMSSNLTPLDPGLVMTSLEGDAVDVGVLFSTDGRLADDTWLVLEDDKGMAAADNVVPVGKQELVDAYGDDLAAVLDKISAELTTDDLIEMNKRVDIDHDDAEDIAKDWLDDHGF